jgi:hypothetical protein
MFFGLLGIILNSIPLGLAAVTTALLVLALAILEKR